MQTARPSNSASSSLSRAMLTPSPGTMPIRTADTGITIDNSDYNNLTANNANSNGVNGINLTNANWNNLTNNHALNNGQDGIYLEGSANNNLTGNVANNDSKNGFVLNGSNNNVLLDNIAINNSGAWNAGFLLLQIQLQHGE